MILTAHQPVYLPWLGLFHKIYLAEMYCIFDIAQYQTKDFNNRNKIKTNSGDIWLSVPVESKNHFQKKLCDIKIINNGWNKKHFKSIYLAYKKAEFFDRYIGDFERILIQNNYVFLSDLCFDILQYMLKAFAIDVPIVKASDYNFTGYKSALVLDMCLQLGAEKYIFGALGEDYADESSFNKKGIKIFFQNYNHPQYKQMHGEFLPYMSAIDLLFNEGDRSKDILLSGNIKSLEELCEEI
jgi:hypothetical protein